MHVGLESRGQKLLVKQIAGRIARRVVCRAQINDQVQTGEKFGMLKFGSRTEIYLPRTARVRVRPGDRVTAGLTVIGER